MARFQREFEAARRAVGAAVEVCRAVQCRLDEVRAITKDDRSPVTVADLASQAVVAHMLAAEFPGLVLVAEEASEYLREPAHKPHLEATVAAARSAWPGADESAVLEAIDSGGGQPRREGFWTLDPVDGTKGFLRGQQYAVSLAYIEDWRPVVGVLGCPNLSPDRADSPEHADQRGSLAGATAGAGVFALGRAASPFPAVVRPSPDELTICSSVEESHTSQDAVSAVIAALGVPVRTLRVDSQCKYLLVARGQADLYVRLPTEPGYVERIWDHAAGALVATEAGCIVSDITGAPLDFSHGRGLEKNRGVVCATPALHARVIEAIEDLGVR